MGLEGMRHRVIDDAMMEGWIMRALGEGVEHRL